VSEGKAPVEVTLKFVSVFEQLTDAWGFVMDMLDRVGADPEVHIRPVWVFGVDAGVDDDVVGGDGRLDVRLFEVSVSGSVEE